MASDVPTAVDYPDPLPRPSPMCVAGYRKKAVRMGWILVTGAGGYLALGLGGPVRGTVARVRPGSPATHARVDLWPPAVLPGLRGDHPLSSCRAQLTVLRELRAARRSEPGSAAAGGVGRSQRHALLRSSRARGEADRHRAVAEPQGPGERDSIRAGRDTYRLRYRCDGKMYDMVPPPFSMRHAISGVLKAFAGLELCGGSRSRPGNSPLPRAT